MVNKISFQLFLIGILFGSLFAVAQTQCSIANCGKCNRDGNFCIACIQNYQSTTMGQCIIPTISNCMFVQSDSFCVSCNPNYKPTQQGTICQKTFDGCLQYNTNQVCRICGYSSQMLQNNQCSGVLNCQKFALRNCEKCIQGYQLRNQICVDISPGCAITRTDNGLCSTCNPGYELIGHVCISQSQRKEYCIMYDNNGECSRCKGSLELYNGLCLTSDQRTSQQQNQQTSVNSQNTIQNTQNEISASGSSQETTNPINIFQEDFSSGFNSGFSFNTGFDPGFDSQFNDFNMGFDSTPTTETNFNQGSSGSTFNQGSFQDNSQTTSTTTTQNGFNTQTNTITTTTTTNQQDTTQGSQTQTVGIPFENSFTGTGGLIDSNNNDFSGFGGNSQQNLEVQFCEIYNVFTPGVCVKCINEYYLVAAENKCRPISRFCDGYDFQTGACSACKFELTLRDGKCLDSNCLNYQQQTCIQCIFSYELDNEFKYCRFVDPNCLLFNPNQKCSQCKEKYYINIQSRCILLPPNCLQANPSSGVCQQCANNYEVVNSQCQQKINILNCNLVDQINRVCSLCNERYYLVNGGLGCNQVSPYCGDFNPNNGLCRTCFANGYSLDQNGKCVDRNCLNADQQSLRCFQCAQNYEFSEENKICQQAAPTIRQIQFCQTRNSDNPNNCGVCLEGYYVNLQFTCTQLPSLCRIANPNGQCVRCQQGYQLSQQRCIERIEIPNCQVVNQETKRCIQCSENYIKRNDECFQKQRECFEYSINTGLCLICQEGFYLNFQAACTPLPDKCLKANNFGLCESCEDGFVPFGLECVQNIENCEIIQSPTQCFICKEGYQRNQQSRCSKLPPNCLAIFPNGACSSCADGYYSANSGNCEEVFENCEKMAVSGICQTCLNGYYSNLEGKCSILPDNCLEALATGFCRQCKEGWLRSPEGQCLRNILIQNCTRVSQVVGTQCQLCQNGFYINEQGRCSFLPENCESAFPNGICNSCFPGYAPRGQFCVRQLKNCLQSSIDNNICQRCQQGFYPSINGQCQTLPPNCRQANVNGSCTQCVQNYVPTGLGNCVVLPNNCDIVSPGGFCTKCIRNYYLNLNGECAVLPENCQSALPSGFCQQCASGFNGNQAGFCTRIVVSIPNCINVSGNICQQCQQGWFINNQERCSILPNNCQKAYKNGACETCRDQYYLSNSGECKRVFQNCQQMGFGDFCQICNDGFYLDINGRCEVLSQGCKSALPSGFCSLCNEGYTPTLQGQCSVVIQNCENSNGNICVKCINGYFLNQQNLCRILPNNCAEAQRSGICSRCISGFSVSNGQCVRNIPNCLIVGNNGQCQQCTNSYYPDFRGFCSQKPPNCLQVMPSGECKQCENGYYVNFANFCLLLPQFCNKALANGFCQLCAAGYTVNRQGFCESSMPANCARLNQARICVACNQGFYLNIESSCLILPSNCLEASSNGVCQRCNSNYQVNQRGVCARSIPNCLTLGDGDFCSNCQSGFYLTSQRNCGQLPRFCLSADPNGQCLTCINGYTENNGICALQANNNNTTVSFRIQFCEVYNQDKCQTCQNRYFPIFNSRFCAKVPDSCELYDRSTGICQRCYPNYIRLEIGFCITQGQVSQIRDNNCLRYRNSLCQACSARYYFSEQGKCIPANPFCKSSNIYGYCTDCYPGYTYSNGSCIILTQQTSANDRNCKRYNQARSFCQECYPGFYYNGNQQKCVRVNPLCRTYNSNGGCTGCFQSYELVGEQCRSFTSDPNCRQYDSANRVCLQCSTRFFKDPNNNNRCTQVNLYCKDYSRQSGRCTECFPGYTLVNTEQLFENNQQITIGDCEVGVPASLGDPNCKFFVDTNKSQCRECYPSFLLINGVCQEKNPFCKTVNSTNGACTSCFQGYSIVGNTCQVTVQTQTVNSQFNDPYCVKYLNSNCIECSQGYYFDKATKICTLLDPYCKTHDKDNGDCETCYPGFALFQKKCVIQSSFQVQTQQTLTIQFCEEYSNDNLRCLRCMPRYYFDTNTNNCEVVEAFCEDYDQNTGKCLSCLNGYFYQDNTCVQVGYFDENCLRYTNAYCSRCRGGYFVNSYYCEEVDPNCMEFNYQQVTCKRCRGSLMASGTKCIEI